MTRPMTGATLSVRKSYLLIKSIAPYGWVTGNLTRMSDRIRIKKQSAFREGIPERRKWATIED